jgi:hypothetical protein
VEKIKAINKFAYYYPKFAFTSKSMPVLFHSFIGIILCVNKSE